MKCRKGMVYYNHRTIRVLANTSIHVMFTNPHTAPLETMNASRCIIHLIESSGETSVKKFKKLLQSSLMNWSLGAMYIYRVAASNIA